MSLNVVLCSRVRLARNFADLPFDVSSREDLAAKCVTRTVNAMRSTRSDMGYELLRLRELSEVSAQCIQECNCISKDLMHNAATAAVMLNHEQGMSIMIGEEDHLRIQATRRGLDLLSAASAAFRVDDALSQRLTFAFDEQLGYLTAYPTNTGTGMRASLLMHLPMLTRGKKMGQVVQLVAKVGMNIRGVYGEGSEALGDVYLLSNQVSLGRSEQELISMVTTLGHQLMDMEQSLRAMALQDGRLPLEDVIWRAYGVLSNARILPMNEFYDHWSNLRLGAALGLINLSPDQVDTLLDMAQPAHLCCWREEDLTGRDLDKARADRVRDALIS